MQHKKNNHLKKQNLSGCHCHYIALHPGFRFLKVHTKSSTEALLRTETTFLQTFQIFFDPRPFKNPLQISLLILSIFKQIS